MIDKIINLNKFDCPEIDSDGTKRWYNEEGQLHCEYGPAVIESDGYIAYYQDDKLHRLDGPAIIYPNGTVEYWVNGKRHRTDGPAVIDARGFEEYWENENEITKEEFLELYPPESGTSILIH